MTKIKIITAVLLTVLVGGTAYGVYNKNSTDNTTSRTDPTQKSKDPIDKPKSESKEIPKAGKETSSTNEADQRAEQESSSSTETTAIRIIDNYQTDSELGIRLDIGRLKSGSCSISINRGSKTVTKDAKIALVTSYYACQGFSVPLNELPAGKWTVTATAVSGGQTYKSAPVEVTIK